MNIRLSITAAIAVFLTSLSLNAVVAGNGWIAAGLGAVATVAAVGILTRTTGLPSVVATTFLVLIGVVPLLSGTTWPGRAAGLVIVAATAASAAGSRLLRGFAVLAAYLAGLLIYLCATFAPAASFGRVIPSSSSLTVLGHMYRLAAVEFKFAPPVPDIRSVSLVTAGGIGLIAIAVDILAVRLRRPAVAGLPLLLLFSVPVTTDLKQFAVGQSITFALSLAGYLALLSADGRDRLRMWGRLVTFRHVQTADETGSGPDTSELSASGRRIGLAAVCLAVIVPAILPPGHAHDLFGTTSTGQGHGAEASALQPLLQVEQQLARTKPEPVLSYQTTAPNAGQQYFQVYALNYDASENNWLPSFPFNGDRPLQGNQLPWHAPGVVASTPVATSQTTIRMSSDQSGQAILPIPYAPYKLSISGDPWLETENSLMIFSTTVPLANLRYTVTSKEVSPTEGQISAAGPMPPAIDAAYGAYNGPYASQLLQLALAHTSGASTELQEAKDLQSWFLSGQFTYSLHTDLPKSPDWLLKFLTTDRRGVCRQFAWAFAVLARLLGIPSRIGVGYTAGSYLGHGAWQVTTQDAHAWPELYFPGYGWLRFEPTPSGVHGQGTATVPTYASGPGTGSTLPQQGHSGKTAGGSNQLRGSGGHVPRNNRAAHLGGSTTASGLRTHGAGMSIAIIVLVVLFLLLTWPSLTRLATRRRRWLTASGDVGLAHAAWRELADDMTDLGLAGSPGETPRTVARRIAKEGALDPAAVQAVTRICTAEERALYSQLPQPGAGLAADVRTVRRAVAASVSRRQRALAVLAPASTLAAAMRLMQRGGEMLSWLESSWPTVRRQLRAALHRSG